MVVSAPVRFLPPFRLLAHLALLPITVALADPPAPPTFLQALPPVQRSSAGINRLSAPEVAALDELIQRDIQSARQGDVVAFAKTFTERRTAAERQQAGIDHLTGAERAKLDQLVAAEVANRPMVAYVDRGIRPHLPDTITATKPLPEVHGQVSLFMGGSSHGGSFYGGSFDAVVIDPSKRLMIGVGMSEVRGRGLRPCEDGPLW